MSFKIPAGMKKRVDLLAEATRRSRTFVIEEAIEQYLTTNEWQVQSIQAGLNDLDNGRVLSQEEMEKLWDE
ncbi:CopG family ribbon-helix-helix protein [Chlorobaculum limnaeum]|uniref:CopG family ribbon-helix-helix protein n=1 Tax=Chlorobaculum limnaeum TaxID=274537 RepID=UPI001F215E01|nr:CopG family ribbon-helix-helix protein [Chlorobaculum limnaeum]